MPCDGPRAGGRGGTERAEGRSQVDGGVDQRRLALLRQEHGDLDASIVALQDGGTIDQLQVARLKKRKLLLKDEIAALEDSMLPDIIA